MSTRCTEERGNEALSEARGCCESVLEADLDKTGDRALNAAIETKKAGFEWQQLLLRIWRTIRELSGDDAYDRYLAHLAACHPNATPQARKDFFRHHQQEKWGGIRRCC